jgi:ParB family chromosome partitioning protein
MGKKLELNHQQKNTDVFNDPLLKSMLGCGDATLGIRQTEPLEIPVQDCFPWHDEENTTQPFHMYPEDKLQELAADMEARGLDNPIIVRPYEAGYQILAGHNRVEAAKLIHWETIPAKIVNADDDAARLIMVNTNLLQRDKILPSEKAKAYKIRVDSLQRQLGRPPKDNEGQIVPHLTGRRTTEIIGENTGENYKQIQRYIRLNFLLPDVLKMVDTEQIPFTAGVALSYLSPSKQHLLENIMDEHEVTTINGKQAEFFKSRGDSLDEDTIKQIFRISDSSAPPAPKPPQSITIKIPAEVWGDLPPELAKDTTLLQLIAEEIKRYAEETKCPT